MPRLVNPGAAGAGFTTDALYAFLRQGTTQIGGIAPSAAAHAILTAGAAAWGQGAYVQIVPAGILAGHVITGCTLNVTAADDFEIDIAFGAAASEVVELTLPILGQGTPNQLWVPNPVIQVPVNSRVACRARSLNGASTVKVKMIFMPRSL